MDTPAVAKLVCDLYYLSLVVWREARGASSKAQVAVAHSVLNRVKRPGWWGTDISSVATKKWQYSSLTDPNDKQLTKWPVLSDASFIACFQSAYDALHGDVANPFPGADSYFDDSIAPPNWTAKAKFCGKVDNLNFYDVDGDFEANAIVNAAAVKPSSMTDFETTLRDFLKGK